MCVRVCVCVCVCVRLCVCVRCRNRSLAGPFKRSISVRQPADTHLLPPHTNPHTHHTHHTHTHHTHTHTGCKPPVTWGEGGREGGESRGRGRGRAGRLSSSYISEVGCVCRFLTFYIDKICQFFWALPCENAREGYRRS